MSSARLYCAACRLSPTLTQCGRAHTHAGAGQQDESGTRPGVLNGYLRGHIYDRGAAIVNGRIVHGGGGLTSLQACDCGRRRARLRDCLHGALCAFSQRTVRLERTSRIRANGVHDGPRREGVCEGPQGQAVSLFH